MMPAKPEATAVTTPTAAVEHRASTRRVLKSHSKGELIKLVERLDRAEERQREEKRPAACPACDSKPGQYHAPECPAVDAFTAGRIPRAEDTGSHGGEA